MVSAVNDMDAVDDTGTVGHTEASTDMDYSGITTDLVLVTVTDNENMSVMVSNESETYSVAEIDDSDTADGEENENTEMATLQMMIWTGTWMDPLVYTDDARAYISLPRRTLRSSTARMST